MWKYNVHACAHSTRHTTRPGDHYVAVESFAYLPNYAFAFMWQVMRYLCVVQRRAAS